MFLIATIFEFFRTLRASDSRRFGLLFKLLKASVVLSSCCAPKPSCCFDANISDALGLYLFVFDGVRVCRLLKAGALLMAMMGVFSPESILVSFFSSISLNKSSMVSLSFASLNEFSFGIKNLVGGYDILFFIFN